MADLKLKTIILLSICLVTSYKTTKLQLNMYTQIKKNLIKMNIVYVVYLIWYLRIN